MTTPRHYSQIGCAAFIVLLLGTTPAAHAQQLAGRKGGIRFHVQMQENGWRDTASGSGDFDSLVVQDAARSSIVRRDPMQPAVWRASNASRWPRTPGLPTAAIAGILLGTTVVALLFAERRRTGDPPLA